MTAMIPLSLAAAGVSWATAGTSGSEKYWRNNKDLPQYKYIARPVYKFVASYSNTIIP